MKRLLIILALITGALSAPAQFVRWDITNETVAFPTNFWPASSNEIFLQMQAEFNLRLLSVTNASTIGISLINSSNAPIPALKSIQFTGTGVTATDDKTNIVVNITAGSGSWPVTNSGAEIKKAFFIYTNKASTTATIPTDNSTPQSNEGGGTFTNAFTPVSANSNSVLHIQMTAYVGTSIARSTTGAIFRDGAADAIGATYSSTVNVDNLVPLVVHAFYTNTSNAEVSFAFNYGANAAATTYINRGNAASLTNVFEAALFSVMTITEIQQ